MTRERWVRVKKIRGRAWESIVEKVARGITKERQKAWESMVGKEARDNTKENELSCDKQFDRK